jgi:hypothetical protein
MRPPSSNRCTAAWLRAHGSLASGREGVCFHAGLVLGPKIMLDLMDAAIKGDGDVQLVAALILPPMSFFKLPSASAHRHHRIVPRPRLIAK